MIINMIGAEAERIAINTPIQGTAADLIKMAMINIHARLKRDGYKTPCCYRYMMTCL
jgi:DNA polymerase-1